MKTFYVTFGVLSVLRNVLLKVSAKDRQSVCDHMVETEKCKYFCEVYAQDEATAKEKAKRYGLVIVDGGKIE